MSTVFYRWGAGKDESRVTFDGTHISVFDFKREVILNNRMGNGKDFDLGVFDNVTGEEIKDDNHLIARSSSLVVRRMPASLGKNRGTAQNYIVGTLAADALGNEHRIEASAKQALLDKQNRRAGVPGIGGAGGAGSLSRRFDGKGDEAIGNAQAIGSGGAPVISTGNEEEDRRIAAFFEQSGDQWERTQEDMSLAPGRQQQFRNRATSSRPGIPGGPGAGPSGGAGGSGGRFDYSLPPDREPPVGYICYRCGQKGHWIQNCPINEDPSASDRKRFNRVTGIPRSFLKTVEAPNTGEGSSGGAMLTADGGFVMAMPDQRQWQKQQSIKRRAQNDLADLPYPPELTCPLDRRLFAEAVKVPCCGTTYCEECITTHLVEHDFECPACESKVASLKRLKKDEDVRARVDEWKEENEGEVKQEVPGASGAGGGGAEDAQGAEGERERAAGDAEGGKAVEEQDVKPDISAEDSAPVNAQQDQDGQGVADVKREEQEATAKAARDSADDYAAEEPQSEPEEGAASPTKPSAPILNAPSGPSADRAKSTKGEDAPTDQARPAAIASLDPNKMQEMLDPQTMQIYLSQIQKMLLNPVVKPEARALLIAQRQLVQATVMQMQLAGMGPSNAVGNANGHRQAGAGQHMNGQQQNQQANMGMQGMMMPDMGMGMGMNMNMNMMGNMSGMAVPNQMQQMQQMQQMEQMMMMNMGNMGNMGDAAMQNMQGQGMGGMTPNAQHGNNFPQGGGGNFGPGVRGGRGGFPRGGPALGLRGRGRGRGGMAMGMGMGMGHNMHQGPGHAQGPTGIKRGMEEAFDGGPEGKMARVG